MTVPEQAIKAQRTQIAARIEDYIVRAWQAYRDDLPDKALALETTLAGIVRNEWLTIRDALTDAIPSEMGVKCALDPTKLSDNELILCLEELRKRDAAALTLHESN